MQEPGSRTAPPFAGVDLRRPKGYPALAPAEGEACPRCESRDTKFCYYNNYNTTQPRHYCRSCRRYWTKGGSLRNVPVGGASRNGTSSSSSSSPPKRTKNSSSKRRRVVPEPEPEPVGTDASAPAAAARAATVTTEAMTKKDAPADDLAGPPAVDTEPSVKLGVGLADAGGKEPSPFEWPSGCDDLQGISYWGTSVLADTDPAMFLNLP